jgi:hypothetical protein
MGCSTRHEILFVDSIVQVLYIFTDFLPANCLEWDVEVSN